LQEKTSAYSAGRLMMWHLQDLAPSPQRVLRRMQAIVRHLFALWPQ